MALEAVLDNEKNCVAEKRISGEDNQFSDIYCRLKALQVYPGITRHLSSLAEGDLGYSIDYNGEGLIAEFSKRRVEMAVSENLSDFDVAVLRFAREAYPKIVRFPFLDMLFGENPKYWARKEILPKVLEDEEAEFEDTLK